MNINWIKACFATFISFLLAWWLWSMGDNTLHQWLLAGLGGLIIEIGLLGSMGLYYPHERSGAQVRIVMSGMAIITFVACCIYSFFNFSVIGFCVPMGLFTILALLLGHKIYKSEM